MLASLYSHPAHYHSSCGAKATFFYMADRLVKFCNCFWVFGWLQEEGIQNLAMPTFFIFLIYECLDVMLFEKYI